MTAYVFALKKRQSVLLTQTPFVRGTRAGDNVLGLDVGDALGVDEGEADGGEDGELLGSDEGDADGYEVGLAVGAGEYDTWKSNESVIDASSAQDSVNVYVLTSNEPGTT